MHLVSGFHESVRLFDETGVVGGLAGSENADLHLRELLVLIVGATLGTGFRNRRRYSCY
jgi:hypothetical protein